MSDREDRDRGQRYQIDAFRADGSHAITGWGDTWRPWVMAFMANREYVEVRVRDRVKMKNRTEEAAREGAGK